MNTLKVGDVLPSFSVTDQNGKTHSNTDYTNQKLIVFFYPKANTPGCTAEACDLRDRYSELQKAGYALLGVSADSEKKQKNFSRNPTKYYFFLLSQTGSFISKRAVWKM